MVPSPVDTAGDPYARSPPPVACGPAGEAGTEQVSTGYAMLQTPRQIWVEAYLPALQPKHIT